MNRSPITVIIAVLMIVASMALLFRWHVVSSSIGVQRLVCHASTIELVEERAEPVRMFVIDADRSCGCHARSPVLLWKVELFAGTAPETTKARKASRLPGLVLKWSWVRARESRSRTERGGGGLSLPTTTHATGDREHDSPMLAPIPAGCQAPAFPSFVPRRYAMAHATAVLRPRVSRL